MVAGLAVRAREGARSQNGTLGAHALPLEPTSNLSLHGITAATVFSPHQGVVEGMHERLCWRR